MAALTWDCVHLDDEEPANCRWHLIDRKQGADIYLPLSSQAASLLRMRRAAAEEAEKPSPFVFPSWSKTGRITDARSAMKIVSAVAGRHLSLHDLRRTFTNVAMRECRLGKFETDMLTGHKPAQEDVTARNYLDLTNLGWLQPDVQKIGDWIEQQGRVAAAQANGANVVALRA
jgi:integrase